LKEQTLNKMANADLSSATIGQASINVHDVDKAVAFYRDTLGLRFLFQAGPKMAFFDCGGVRLMLAVPKSRSSITPARSSISRWAISKRSPPRCNPAACGSRVRPT
jgi:catechol 2,3-dioxygenase-like lactoylglutathione lyase family enzyme